MSTNEKLRKLNAPATGANIVRKIDLSKHKRARRPGDVSKPIPKVERKSVRTRPLHEVKGSKR